METRIRQAGIDDLPLLLAQRRGMFREMGYTDTAVVDQMAEAAERFIRDSLADGWYRAWVAEAAGWVVAGGAVHIVPWIPGCGDPSPSRAYIHSLYTEPEFRRRGIARQLMDTMVAWCRERGFRSVTLHASDAGRRIYEAMGFTATNEMRLLF